ncbi:hypothetical protein C8R45DRAFT_1012259 [Mycena sanguinolenta]|nr:hypothetical protein C8R45DRAFT_1012259 [Mycena sanguinolenta]
MAILLNDTPGSCHTVKSSQNITDLENPGLELEELSGPQLLPFVDDDPCGELGGRQGRIRTRAAINDVSLHCWKALRMPQISQKPGPQDLSLFPQMPVDILLEVLGHLHPIDLRHVARANKAFSILLRSQDVLWRSAFVGHPPLPLCPPEISGRRWARLLFGARECDECGTTNTAPDYRLWRRLCTECMNSKLVETVPSYSSSHDINTLVVKTFRDDGRTSNADSDIGRLWRADGIAVAQEFERLAAADADSPGILDAFIEARKQTVQTIVKRADEAEVWGDKVHDDLLHRWTVHYRRVVASSRKRLIDEGHDPLDAVSDEVDWDRAMAYLEDFPRLTSKRWNKARPHVLPLVAAARAYRLERERALLVANRTAAVGVATSYVLRTAPPTTWPYAPPYHTIEALPQLQALIHDPSDTPLPDDDPRLAHALLSLPAFVEAWRSEKRALLASLLPRPTGCASASASTKPEPDLDRLGLATSVFTCLGSWVGAMSVTAGRSLIGWAGAGAHLRCRSLRSFWDRRVHFASEGAEAAAALVRLVGLNPDTATAGQMDEFCGGELHTGAGAGKGAGGGADLDRRFVCMLCPVEVHRGMHGRRAMRWRECVQHTIERTRMNGGDAAHLGAAPAWALLTDAAVDDLRRRERGDPVVFDDAWACTLCTAHYEGRTTRAQVVEHVRVVHQIREPLVGTHFMYFTGSERRKPRLPALVSQEVHVLELRCTWCAQGKLRSLREIRRHVADKHHITAPNEADWTRVELILRTTQIAGAPADAGSATDT